MKDDDLIFQEIAYLTFLSKEGKLSDKQFERLEALLKTDGFARRCYVMLINNDLFLYDSDIINCFSDQSAFGLGDLKALAEYERSAPRMEILDKKAPRELIQKVVYPPKAERKLSRSGIFAILNAAAVIFFFLVLKLTPPNGRMEVAVLSDTWNARWADTSAVLKSGTRLAAGEGPWMLRDGVAEVVFDNDARIVLEAPCEFDILTSDQIQLNYGRLYAAIPREAVGFTVNTPSARVIDLGTEFGVQSDFDGNTQLHVLKGKTVLMAGAANKVHLEVSAGAAKKVAAATGEIADIRCRSDYFVRAVNSAANCVWRGQNQINLADVVGGGNGFGTGVQGMGINPASGSFRKAESITARHSNVFTPVPANPFVDGVFVPNGFKEQIVSTAGHIFKECPSTSGYFYMDIANTPSMAGKNGEPGEYDLYLNQTNYSQRENSCILLHSNAGITFDLEQYRKCLPGIKIVRFQSEIGISNSAPRDTIADFWILVDGQVRYSSPEPMRRGRVETVAVEISQQDRFLTLVVTDGSIHNEAQDQNAIGYDWGVFGKPFLMLE